MPAYKNKESGKWYVVTQYTDWTGARKQKCKRGFNTRREAQEWEQKFQQQSAGDLDMSFEAFVEIYTADLKARLKESTWQTKDNVIKTKIIPYFGKRKINEITTKDVIAWQNELLAYRDEKHKSNRTIQMPDFLCEEMQEFFKMQYGLKKKDRIFTINKGYLHREMDRGAEAAGVKRIRIHDLRHSHISLLIDMGFSAVAIADRVGHESIEITYRYAHLFPSKQKEMASKLDDLSKGA